MVRCLVVVVAVSLSALSCASAQQPCTSSSCTGCCSSSGQCLAGDSNTACGAVGNACTVCQGATQCQFGQCVTTSVGGGGGGATGGGSGGGGGAPSDGGVDGGADAGVMDAGVDGGWEVVVLDAAAREAMTLAMAVDRTRGVVGVAYFTPRGTQTMSGAPDYDLRYVEWHQGTVSAPQTIRFVQRVVGLALAFDPATGEPVVAALGGAPGSVQGQSTWWYQSDAALYRRSGATWTESVVAATGAQVTCGNPLSDRGFLVGLWPALAFDSTGKLYFGYRDGHDAQFPQQDWASSDVEVWEGTTGRCVAEGGNSKGAWGGHLQLVIGAADQPAVLHEQMFAGADGAGMNLYFQKRSATSAWSAPTQLVGVASTQTGAALAWDPTEGFGVAFLERSANELSYLRSSDGVTWTAPEPVFGAGSGGWYPSLAIDPVDHTPAVAFAYCGALPNLGETQCPTTSDALVITQRVGATWHETVVDPGGAYLPKLGFFATGKGVVAYRTPPALDTAGQPTVAGMLKLALER